ncbi:hypothetical protein ABC382_00225 [Lysinibacillus sp. 1P01SD]|uniref:hypothetical protein n=1 Tax=Lysinibacillus sp. 1P01SD TaxID=3132285 RepID=UPI00399FE266
MAVRKQRATTRKEIMESDIEVAIKKAKVRYRDEKLFYILKYQFYFFASGYPELDSDKNEIYYQKWVFDGKWKKVDDRCS